MTMTKGHEGNDIVLVENPDKETLLHNWGIVWDEVVAYPVSEGVQEALDYVDAILDGKAYQLERQAEVKKWEERNHEKLIKEYIEYLQEQTKGWEEAYCSHIEGYWEWVDTELLKEQVPF